MLHFASSTYYDYKRREPSERTLRDEELKVLITETYEANYRVYGAKKLSGCAECEPATKWLAAPWRDLCVSWALRAPLGVRASLSPPSLMSR